MMSGRPDVPASDAVDAFMCKGDGPKALISKVTELLSAPRSANPGVQKQLHTCR